jgi:hypothetical protein
MCTGIALAWTSLPAELIGPHALEHRVHDRGGELEVHFIYHDFEPRLPIRHGGQLRIVRWGNRRGQSAVLPRTGWTWQATIDEGIWRHTDARLVEIPATLGLDKGVWFRIRQGILGLLVSDENGHPVVYMVCEPASHYYRVMTRSDRMPVLIDERI